VVLFNGRPASLTRSQNVAPENSADTQASIQDNGVVALWRGFWQDNEPHDYHIPVCIADEEDLSDAIEASLNYATILGHEVLTLRYGTIG
jgi:hypothetical protein